MAKGTTKEIGVHIEIWNGSSELRCVGHFVYIRFFSSTNH